MSDTGQWENIPNSVVKVKWEYKTVTLPDALSSHGLQSLLNTEGEEGWELCATEYRSFIFKRQK